MSKVALITGGSRGIGRGVADLLHEKGYQVAITSRKPADDEAQAKFLCICADNSSAEDRERAVNTVLEKFGRIDLLVNNAGIAPRQGLITDCTADDWDRLFAVKDTGVALVIGSVLFLLVTLAARILCSIFVDEDPLMYLLSTLVSCAAESILLIVLSVLAVGVILLLVNLIVRKVQSKRAAKAAV